MKRSFVDIKLLLTALALLFLVTVGCENGATSSPPPPSKETPSQSKENKNHTTKKGNVPQKGSTRQSGTLPEVVSKEDVWRDQKIITFDQFLHDQRAWSADIISEEGLIVGVVPHQNKKPEEMILFDPATRTHDVILSVKNSEELGGAQVGGVDMNKKWIVWSEPLDQSFSKWNIHVYDRIKKKDRIVATNPKDANGDGYGGTFMYPSLYGDEFVWSPVVAPPLEIGPSVAVKKYNIKTGKSTDIAPLGGNPIITKDFIIWSGPDKKADDTGALFWNKNGKIEQITNGYEIHFYATDGKAVAWSGHDKNEPGWSLGLIENGSERKIFSTSKPEDVPQFLSMSDRIVAWEGEDKVQVYDRKLDKVVTLEDDEEIADMCNVYTRGNYLFWTTPISATPEDIRAAKDMGILPHRMHLIEFKD